MTIYGGIEAGGTKFICVIGSGPDEILAETRVPTTTPDETIQHVIRFFKENSTDHPLRSVGVGSFGPVDLDTLSPTYGYITTTPKPGWMNTNLLGAIQEALSLPVTFDTDVNTAALGEQEWGAAQGMHDFLYVTIGTGIGGGALINNQLLHGLIHPEMGHIRLPHDFEADPFPGICPFHGDCFEGLASGPALQHRWGGHPAETLPENHPCWQLEAHYIALAVHNLVCDFSPQRVILGGGVMENRFLFPMVRQEVHNLVNGYIQTPLLTAHREDFIVPPGLGNRSGVLGALVLAMRSYPEE
ncbi:MAG: ROK family protein [Chloroflexi bacterium]|nr:ROK family protein [Chloroflexota bacterium]